MKTLLLILLIAFVSNCQSQENSKLPKLKMCCYELHYYQNDTNYISINFEDSSIRMNGDTTKVLRYLLNEMYKKSQEKAELWALILAGIRWANTVPDIYHTNESWKKYLLLLNEKGYTYGKIKP